MSGTAGNAGCPGRGTAVRWSESAERGALAGVGSMQTCRAGDTPAGGAHKQKGAASKRLHARPAAVPCTASYRVGALKHAVPLMIMTSSSLSPGRSIKILSAFDDDQVGRRVDAPGQGGGGHQDLQITRETYKETASAWAVG